MRGARGLAAMAMTGRGRFNTGGVKAGRDSGIGGGPSSLMSVVGVKLVSRSATRDLLAEDSRRPPWIHWRMSSICGEGMAAFLGGMRSSSSSAVMA